MTITITELLPDTSSSQNSVEWVEIITDADFDGTVTLTIDGKKSDSIDLDLDAGQYAVLYNTNSTPPSVPEGAVLVGVSNWPDIPTGGNNQTFDVSISDGTVELDSVSDIPKITGQSAGQTYDVGRESYGAATPGAPECFLSGTLILTQSGETKVEDLSVGDLVKTVGGKFEAIKWIGHQTIDPQSPQNPFRALPIQIVAGALGNNLPVRDLFVSPDHAILVDGVLVNAGALENGISIVKTQPKESFIYFHIELENHSLLIAEGTAAESYLSQNQDREIFDNSAEYERLYPNSNALSLLPMSLPRVSSQRQLPQFIQKRLMQIAETLPTAKTLAAV